MLSHICYIFESRYLDISAPTTGQFFFCSLRLPIICSPAFKSVAPSLFVFRTIVSTALKLMWSVEFSEKLLTLLGLQQITF